MTDCANSFDARRRLIFYPKTDVDWCADWCKALLLSRDDDLARYLPVVHEICLRHWGQEPACVEPIRTGTFHVLYRFDIAPGDSYVVRLNRLKDYRVAWGLMLEAWAYGQLTCLGLPAPTVVATDVSRMHCQTDYQITTYVQGQQLTAFQDPETQYTSLVLLQAVGEYVARVHKITTAGYGPLSVASLAQVPTGVHTQWSDYIMVRLDEHIAVCQAIGAITSVEAAAITDVFARRRDLLDGVSPVLLHGDLGSHNMLSADGATVAALIDWEDCMSGDPVFDIAFWGTFVREHMLDDFLIGYRRVAVLPDDFEVRYWLYYLRVALSKTVHRHRFGYADRPGRPPASQRIQRALARLLV